MAAGHTLTAEAGAEVLREGGNAVDACIAAACMSWVTESTLTSPGGGGFLLVRESSTGRVRLHDFFISIPGQGLARPSGEMEAVDVEFDRGASQIFRIGAASCGVPGAIAGLGGASQDGDFRHQLDPRGLTQANYGYAGIVVAALARYNPFAVVLIAFLLGGLQNAGYTLQGADFPNGLVGVLQGLILFCALGGELFVRYRVRIERRRTPTPEPAG